MNDELDKVLQGLRREYITESAERLAELREGAAEVSGGGEGAAASLAGRFHRLAGSGGSYGFPQVSEIARRMERRLKAGVTSGDLPAAGEVEAGIEELARAFEEAKASLPDSVP